MTQQYKRGDTREDGYIFLRYQTTYKGTQSAVFISPEALERQRQHVREWKEANAERVKLHRDRWRKANPTKVAASMKKWREKKKKPTA